MTHMPMVSPPQNPKHDAIQSHTNPSAPTRPTMDLEPGIWVCQIYGKTMGFLLDSGSTHNFMDLSILTKT